MVRLAFIGCGRIASKHAQALAQNFPNISLVSACDLELKKAEQFVKSYQEKFAELSKENFSKLNVYTDYIKMIKKEEFDAVAIATESGYHHPIVIKCLKENKHILVEKPMAMSVEQAKEMISLSQEKGLRLSVCFQNRYNSTIQELKKTIENGKLGKIYAGNARILWRRDQNYYNQAKWRGTKELDGGCLMNQCIHNIDLLQWMMGGDIETVQGFVANFCHPYIEMEDYGTIQIKFKNGSIGNVEGTVNLAPKDLEESLSILGTNGSILIGGIALNEVKTWSIEGEDIDINDQKRKLDYSVANIYGHGHSMVYADFIHSIEDSRKPYISGEDGIKSIEIIEAVYKLNYKG